MDLPTNPLSSDKLIALVRENLKEVPEYRTDPQIPLIDALMAGYAIFSLKMKSLLAFDDYKKNHGHNLKTLFGIDQAPCDTQMRTILDPIDPQFLRSPFTAVFRQLQRSKVLESYVFRDNHYLLVSDGTTYHSSTQVHCPNCLEKRSRNGEVTYYHQMLGLALVHPDQKTVIPLCPEPIIKQDGTTKNDCERSATRRALEHFRREHPHLKVILVEDALSGNAPHIDDLIDHNIRYILSIKPGSHTHLFNEMNIAYEEGRAQVHTEVDADGTLHHFRWLADVAVNQSRDDLRNTMVEYWEIPPQKETERITKTNKIKKIKPAEIRHFSWITDLDFDPSWARQFSRGGRARWQIENNVFNTLKNQGYQFEHNFGHGDKNLSVVMAFLMMLAFFVDQVMQLCDPLFQKVLAQQKRKIRVWECLQSMFRCFLFNSMSHVLETILDFELVEAPTRDKPTEQTQTPSPLNTG